MSFQVGDIVWVPSQTVPGQDCSTKCQYWPARFIKQTNRPDICIVSLFKATLIKEPDEQFIVDTEEILGFQGYQPLNPEPSFIPVYQNALKDFKQRQKKKLILQQEYIITNSLQFCQFVEKLLVTHFIPQAIKAKQERKAITIPKFKAGLPVGIKDLQLYFKRRIPQMIAFMHQSQLSEQKEQLIKFLKDAKEKINTNLIKALKTREINLRAR